MNEALLLTRVTGQAGPGPGRDYREAVAGLALLALTRGGVDVGTSSREEPEPAALVTLLTSEHRLRGQSAKQGPAWGGGRAREVPGPNPSSLLAGVLSPELPVPPPLPLRQQRGL